MNNSKAEAEILNSIKTLLEDFRDQGVIMKLKSTLKISLVFCLLAYPAMAAFDNNSMMPSFSTAWGGLNDYLKEKITWLIGIAVVVLVAAGVLYSLLSGGGVLISGARGDAVGRSQSLSNMVLGVAVIFAALLAVSIIFFLVN